MLSVVRLNVVTLSVVAPNKIDPIFVMLPKVAKARTLSVAVAKIFTKKPSPMYTSLNRLSGFKLE